MATKLPLFSFLSGFVIQDWDPLIRIRILRNIYRSTTLSSGRYCTVIVSYMLKVSMSLAIRDVGFIFVFLNKLCNSRLFIARLGKPLTFPFPVCIASTCLHCAFSLVYLFVLVFFVSLFQAMLRIRIRYLFDPWIRDPE